MKLKEALDKGHSYIAGRARGLSPKCHDVCIETPFEKWIEAATTAHFPHQRVPIVFDPVAFEEGYNDGIKDYDPELFAKLNAVMNSSSEFYIEVVASSDKSP